MAEPLIVDYPVDSSPMQNFASEENPGQAEPTMASGPDLGDQDMPVVRRTDKSATARIDPICARAVDDVFASWTKT